MQSDCSCVGSISEISRSLPLHHWKSDVSVFWTAAHFQPSDSTCIYIMKVKNSLVKIMASRGRTSKAAQMKMKFAKLSVNFSYHFIHWLYFSSLETVNILFQKFFAELMFFLSFKWLNTLGEARKICKITIIQLTSFPSTRHYVKDMNSLHVIPKVQKNCLVKFVDMYLIYLDIMSKYCMQA
jgi:hypothetical protein